MGTWQEIDIERGAQTLADLAWMEVAAWNIRPVDRITIVLKAYLWAIASLRPFAPDSPLMVWPSLNELRAFLATHPDAPAAARKAERRCICNDETGEYCDSDSSPLADDVAPADPKDER